MYEQQLCTAIRERKAIKFRHDDDLMERTFEPYIVYWNDKRHELVAGYQAENPAKPLERDVWREFSLDKLRTLRITDALFAPKKSFNPLNKRYLHGTVCQVFQHFR